MSRWKGEIHREVLSPFGKQLPPSKPRSTPKEASAMSTNESDRQAIIDLTIDYCWTLDSKDFDHLAEIFHSEATAFLGTERPNRESIIEKIRGSLLPLDASQHLVANHQVRLDGDRATCRCYLQAQHVRTATQGGVNYIIGGRYEDDLVRTPQGWRIMRRVLHRDWTEGNLAVVRPI
jgi:3-phenylpropionate/cinnamic acid dioxygenase small subunit